MQLKTGEKMQYLPSQLADSVTRRLSALEADSVAARLWMHDPTLWVKDPKEQAEVQIRLGWLHSIEDARKRMDGYLSFAKQVHDEGIDRVLVIGMGGSSLTAEVLSSLLAGANIEAKLSLAILDSTDPQQVADAAKDFPPEKSLYILASKSGGTAELLAAFDYFWELSKGNGSRFVVTTDAGSSLEKLGKERSFRKIFNADPNVGGRFSALTDFGLVPAALLGMDLNKLLDSAETIKKISTDNRSAGFELGALLAESALAGRDKLTILSDAPVSAFAGWIEQVIAESSGKHGKGILPVPLEPLAAPEMYGSDRLFVYLRQTGELDGGVTALKNAGFPVVEFQFMSPYDVGAEFFRWEIAVSMACHILGINTFDQPDVQDSKLRTVAKIKEYQATGKLADVDLVTVNKAKSALKQFLADAKTGDFFTINAYIPRNKDTEKVLQALRVAIREKTKCAVSAGFGPRFQHSTGQFHKGGPNKGRFIQVVYDTQNDMEIPQVVKDADADMDVPAPGMTFGALIRAQALGDYEALVTAGRRVLRIKLNSVNELEKLSVSVE
jgi:transaldolase / glucose-6-phosphate isomerase